MTFWQGFLLALGAFGVVAVAFLRNLAAAPSDVTWKPTLKAGGYLVGTALLLIFTPHSDSIGGWGTLMCLIIAFLSIWIVGQPDTEQILEDHRYDWRYGEDSNGDPRSGLKLLYRAVQVFDRIDGFMWKKIGPFVRKKRGQVARLRYGRRLAFGVLMVLLVLSWTLPLISGWFSSDEPPTMGMGASEETTQSQSTLSAPPTEAAPVTTTPSPVITTTTTSSSSELLDQGCSRPQGSELKDERTEGVKVDVTKDFYVCRDGGQWLAWKDEPAPTSATILSLTDPLPDPQAGKSFVYAVIDVNGMQYYVKAVAH